MLAIAAAVVFGLAFLLQLVGFSTGNFSLLLLGLTLLSLFFAWGYWGSRRGA